MKPGQQPNRHSDLSARDRTVPRERESQIAAQAAAEYSSVQISFKEL
jgi:hypothetical protein